MKARMFLAACLMCSAYFSTASPQKNSLQDSSKALHFWKLSIQNSMPTTALLLADSALLFAAEESNDEVLVKSLLQKAITYNKLGVEDSSLFFFDATFISAKKHNLSPSLRAKIHERYSYFLNTQNKYRASLAHLDTASNFYLSIPDSVSYAGVLVTRSGYYDAKGNRSEALEILLSASKIIEAKGDSLRLSSIFNNLAILHRKLEDLESALQYYQKAIDIQLKLGDETNLVYSYLNRSALYAKTGRINESRSDNKLALELAQKHNMTRLVATIHNNMASDYVKLGKWSLVNYHLQKSQRLAESLKYWYLLAANHLTRSEAFTEQGKLENSIEAAQRAYQLSLENNFIELQIESTRLLAINYEKLDEYKVALKFTKQYKNLADSLTRQNSQEQMNQLRAKFDTEQKEKAIANLRLINDYQSALAKKEEKLKYALEGGIILTFLVMIFFIYLYRGQRSLSNALFIQRNQLAVLNKEKDAIIGTVAHDLRSPLNNIKGILGIMKEVGESRMDSMLDMADQSTDLLRTRINRILDIEAINAGKINLKIDNLDVEELMKQLSNYISPEAEKKQISFQTRVVEKTFCKADENYLTQVLENLCVNAIKFSKQLTEIWVKVSHNENIVRFEVTDQGQGIPKNEIDKLFDRHAKISTKPTGNERSTGLGLSIVKKYVEAMGGNVWCESEVGKGSNFIVELQAV